MATKHTVKWTDSNGNVHYLHNADGHISLILFNGIQVSLSNMDHRRTEEMRMALSPCGSADEMATVLNRFGHRNFEAITPAPKAAPAAAAVEENAAEVMWAKEGGSSVAPMLAHLAANAGTTWQNDAIDGMIARAVQMVEPIDDYETPAREAGWDWPGIDAPIRRGQEKATSWQNACDQDDIPAQDLSPDDFLIVSDHLAGKLEELGETVERDLAGLCVWTKYTPGPAYENPMIIAISQDYDPDYTPSAGAPRP